jgi:hypothetical protein
VGESTVSIEADHTRADASQRESHMLDVFAFVPIVEMTFHYRNTSHS